MARNITIRKSHSERRQEKHLAFVQEQRRNRNQQKLARVQAREQRRRNCK